MNDEFIILRISVIDMFTYEKIIKEKDEKHFFSEKLGFPYNYIRLRPKSLMYTYLLSYTSIWSLYIKSVLIIDHIGF